MPDIWTRTEPDVEAVQVTAENAREVAAWCDGWATDDLRWSEHMSCYRYPDDTDRVLDAGGKNISLAGAMFYSQDEPTPGGVMLPWGVPAKPGLWIVKSEGRFTMHTDEDFRRRYHPKEG